MMLSLGTAYRSFGGEVEASSTPTICRLPDSRRHQLWAIALAPYTAITVEQTACGYEVALKNSGTNQFSIWNTDSSGNFISYSVYSGTSTALESLETGFHQDLNGDGVINLPTTVIEATGNIVLTLSPFAQAATID